MNDTLFLFCWEVDVPFPNFICTNFIANEISHFDSDLVKKKPVKFRYDQSKLIDPFNNTFTKGHQINIEVRS